MKLNETLNGLSDGSINSKYDKIVNNVNKSNNEETTKDNEIRGPDDFYVECLLDDNGTHPYYMDYNYNFNLFNNNTTLRQYNTRNNRHNINDNDFNYYTSNLMRFRNDNIDHNIISTSSDEDMNVENKRKNCLKSDDSKYIKENVNDVDFIYITDDNAPLSSTPKQNNIKKNVNNSSEENKTNSDVIYICENGYNDDRDKTYSIQNRKRKDNEGYDEYSYKNVNENENNRKKKSQKKNIYEIDSEYFDIKYDGSNDEEKNGSNDNSIQRNFNIVDNINNSFEYISNVYNLNEEKYENISEKKPKKSSKRENSDAVNSYNSSSTYSFRTNKNKKLDKNKKNDKNANYDNYFLNESQDILSEECNDNIEHVENNKKNYEKNLSKNINTVKNINYSNNYKDECDFHKIANNNLRNHYLTEKYFTFDMNENYLDKSTYNECESNKLICDNKYGKNYINNSCTNKNYIDCCDIESSYLNEENKVIYNNGNYEIYNNKHGDNNTSNINDSPKNRNYKNNSENCETHFVKDINFDYSFSSNKNDDVLMFNNNTNEHNNNLNNSHNEDIYKYYIS